MLYQLKSFSSQATENPTQTNLRKKKKKKNMGSSK